MQHPDKPVNQAQDVSVAKEDLAQMLQASEQESPNSEHSADKSQENTRVTHPGILPLSRRARILPNLALIALLGSILLLLGLWLAGGFPAASLSTLNQPVLHISSNGSYYAGSTITLQGQNFSHYAIIVLLRDGQPITDTSGNRLAVDSDQNGTFSASLTITPDWGGGDHIISAQDTASQQRATLIIHIEKDKNSP